MDKLLHFIVGMAIAAAPLEKPEHALMLAVAAGIAKEAYDNRNKKTHTADSKDAMATAAGALMVFVYRVEF
jgi:hypothetical protein